MAAAPVQPSPLRFTGHRALAQRLVLATLTGRPVRISQIRPHASSPGLLPHHVSLLRLIDAVTNGAIVEFSYTGTTLLYRPGLIVGSAPGHGADLSGVVRHELPADCARGVSYFLLPLCLLAPFAKAPVNVLFTGPGVITSATAAGDISADSVRTAILPLFAQFGIQLNLEIRINRRSCSGSNGKGGAGEVHMIFGHQIRLPKTLHLLSTGTVRRVRGVAYATGVPAANNARMIDAARQLLNPLVPDTYIFSDVSSAPVLVEQANPQSRRKVGVGFGLSLVAETSSGCNYSADVVCPPSGGVTPEQIGRQCGLQLLENISQGGCVSAVAAPTVLTLMAMGSEDVGRLRISKEVLASEALVCLARDLQAFGAAGWAMRDATDSDQDLVLSIVGKGIGNVGRKMA